MKKLRFCSQFLLKSDSPSFSNILISITYKSHVGIALVINSLEFRENLLDYFRLERLHFSHSQSAATSQVLFLDIDC